jgi:RNA polymerase sigma-70 factor, ECF subfamily
MTRSRSNQEWLSDLMASDEAQPAAIADLREILLRASLFYFSRNLGDFRGLSREEILQRAEDCAQDALMAVLEHLQDFRGDSKFSTWAYKFAINISMMAARRERWKGVSLDELAEAGEDAFLEWAMRDMVEEVLPERAAMQEEFRLVIRNVIEQELTEKQRQVLNLMVFNEVPMDVVVRHLRSNRNAIYKILHDARRKIKQSLQAHGFTTGESIALFGIR